MAFLCLNASPFGLPTKIHTHQNLGSNFSAFLPVFKMPLLVRSLKNNISVFSWDPLAYYDHGPYAHWPPRLVSRPSSSYGRLREGAACLPRENWGPRYQMIGVQGNPIKDLFFTTRLGRIILSEICFHFLITRLGRRILLEICSLFV